MYEEHLIFQPEVRRVGKFPDKRSGTLGLQSSYMTSGKFNCKGKWTPSLQIPASYAVKPSRQLWGWRKILKIHPVDWKTRKEKETFSLLRQRVRNTLVTSKSGTMILQRQSLPCTVINCWLHLYTTHTNVRITYYAIWNIYVIRINVPVIH